MYQIAISSKLDQMNKKTLEESLIILFVLVLCWLSFIGCVYYKATTQGLSFHVVTHQTCRLPYKYVPDLPDTISTEKCCALANKTLNCVPFILEEEKIYE